MTATQPDHRDALTRAMQAGMAVPNAGTLPWFVPTPPSRARRAARRVLGPLLVKDGARRP
jgi:hypothetical protein